MEKTRIINFIRSRYPKAFGIRRSMQRLKISRLQKSLLPQVLVRKCENIPFQTRQTVEDYLIQKRGGILRQVREEKGQILSHALFQSDDIKALEEDMDFCRIAYGFLPSEYCAFELENKGPSERKKYMSDIDTYIFGYTVNDISFLQKVIDKGQSVRVFGYLFGRDYVVISRKSDYTAFKTFIDKHPVFVKKYTNSSMGRNIEKVDIRDIEGSDYDYFSSVISKGKFLLEELVIQNEYMSRFNKTSVNTIRCMTFKTKHGVITPYCFMRTGREGSFVDNGGSGGLVIGVDPATGIVNSDGYDEYNHRYIEHPDSGVTFKGAQLPEWSQMLELCKGAAEKVPDMGFLSFDMAYTDEGWKLIEVNGIGQLIGPQMVYKRGIKEDIKRYLDEMHHMI